MGIVMTVERPRVVKVERDEHGEVVLTPPKVATVEMESLKRFLFRGGMVPADVPFLATEEDALHLIQKRLARLRQSPRAADPEGEILASKMLQAEGFEAGPVVASPSVAKLAKKGKKAKKG